MGQMGTGMHTSEMGGNPEPPSFVRARGRPASIRAAATLIAVILLLSAVPPPPANAGDIYRWTDEDGNVIFSDSPRESADTQTLKPETNTFVQPQSKKSGKPSRKDRMASDEETPPEKTYDGMAVSIYTRPGCPGCAKASAFLKSLNVRLMEYNIQADRYRRIEMLRKSGARPVMPMIDIGGTIIQGFDKATIIEALDAKSAQ